MNVTNRDTEQIIMFIFRIKISFRFGYLKNQVHANIV
jgi:hypothetical protein